LLFIVPGIYITETIGCQRKIPGEKEKNGSRAKIDCGMIAGIFGVLKKTFGVFAEIVGVFEKLFEMFEKKE